MSMVLQAAGRRVAYHTFAHVLGLDITFHLERRTGALSRVLERGTLSIDLQLHSLSRSPFSGYFPCHLRSSVCV